MLGAGVEETAEALDLELGRSRSSRSTSSNAAGAPDEPMEAGARCPPMEADRRTLDPDIANTLRELRRKRGWSQLRAGRVVEPELDFLSNIIKAFNDQFGNIDWSDKDRVHRLITEDIPAKVSEDVAHQNARKHSDKQNARIEHDKALARVMNAVLKDDTELFKQFSDNESFKRWLSDTVFTATYEQSPATRRQSTRGSERRLGTT